MENVSRSRRIRASQVHEVGSSTSSADSVIFTGMVPTSTPNPGASNTSGPSSQNEISQSTTEDVVIDLTADDSNDPNDTDPNDADQSNQSNLSADYHTAPESPGGAEARGEAGEEEVEEDDDSVPDLEAIEREMAGEAGTSGAAAGAERIVETITIGTTESSEDTDNYLRSVSPNKIPKISGPVLPLVLENDVITLEDSSESESDSEGWVNATPSTTSSDDERSAEISRQELRDIVQGITPPTTDVDENDNGCGRDRDRDGDRDANPGAGQDRASHDRRVNFLLMESTVVIDDGIIEGENFQANRVAYHQRNLAKELLIKLLTKMAHLDNELFDVFSDPKKRRKAGNKTSYGIAGDENWPRSLPLSEMLVAYENGYDWVICQPDAEALIEDYGFYHPSVFHVTGVRRVYRGPCYNRTPPPGTPMEAQFNMFRELQPIPARASPSIMIPISPVFVPETPEPPKHFQDDPAPRPEPEVNAIPADASLHFEHNLGLLNLDLEVNNAASAEWAHGVLDAEDALKIPAHLLPVNPFENPREPKKQIYRRSIRGVFVRLILREDKINEAKYARSSNLRPWVKDTTRRDRLNELLFCYDQVAQEVKSIHDHLEAAHDHLDTTADRTAEVMEGLDLNRDAIKAEEARIKIENNKLRPQVRHYFTRIGGGEIGVNYEYVGYHDALFTEAELRAFESLTQRGACTAEDCECPGNPSSCFQSQLNETDRLANLAGRTLAQFVPSREPTMPRTMPLPRGQNGFRPLRQLRPTPIRPRQPASPEPEPEVPSNNSATYIVQPAGMSDNDDDDDEVFSIGRTIPDVPAPVGRPRPNEEYWDSCNIDSE